MAISVVEKYFQEQQGMKLSHHRTADIVRQAFDNCKFSTRMKYLR